MVTTHSPDTAGVLLDVATEIVAQQGAAGLRVDAVARDAGINKRMIYHYFQDREGLIEAVYRRQASILLCPGAMAIDSQNVLRSLLRSIFVVDFEPETAASPQASKTHMRRALQILLPRLMAGVFGSDHPVPQSLAAELVGLSESAWLSFCVDVLSAILPGVASQFDTSEEGIDKVSESSQTSKKPRYRLSSQSRPKTE